jgi:hypothetical protein
MFPERFVNDSLKFLKHFMNVLQTFELLGAYFMHRLTFPTTPYMMEYLTDLNNVPAGHETVTRSISYMPLKSPFKDFSNYTSHDGLCTYNLYDL